MEKKNIEVLVELGFTQTIKTKIRFDEDVDIENPSEELIKLLRSELQSGHYHPSVKSISRKTMRIVDDESLSDYDDRDFWVSLNESNKPILRDSPEVVEWGTKCVLLHTRGTLERYIDSFSRQTFRKDGCSSLDIFNPIFFNKEKEEIYQMFLNKEFKSLSESTFPKVGEYRMGKIYEIFQNRITEEEMKKLDDSHRRNPSRGRGVFEILFLTDVKDYRREVVNRESVLWIIDSTRQLLDNTLRKRKGTKPIK
jgi:hypothetical protein